MAFSFQQRDAEVEHFDVAVLQKHDIFWFDVAVDNPVLMGIGQGVTYLEEDVQHLSSREQRRRAFLHHSPECLSPQVFQDQVLRAPLLTLIQVSLNVWVVEASADLRLTLVAGEDSRSPDHIVMGKLEHDLLQHPSILGKVDTACTSLSEQADDFVVIDALARLVDRWHRFPCTSFTRPPVCQGRDLSDVSRRLSIRLEPRNPATIVTNNGV